MRLCEKKRKISLYGGWSFFRAWRSAETTVRSFLRRAQKLSCTLIYDNGVHSSYAGPRFQLLTHWEKERPENIGDILSNSVIRHKRIYIFLKPSFVTEVRDCLFHPSNNVISVHKCFVRSDTFPLTIIYPNRNPSTDYRQYRAIRDFWPDRGNAALR